jgi:hypothetical protein
LFRSEDKPNPSGDRTGWPKRIQRGIPSRTGLAPGIVSEVPSTSAVSGASPDVGFGGRPAAAVIYGALRAITVPKMKSFPRRRFFELLAGTFNCVA